MKKVGREILFQTCVPERVLFCSHIVNNLAAFIIVVCKPSTLRILKKLLYHLLDMQGVAEKSMSLYFLMPFMLIYFFVSKVFGFSFFSFRVHAYVF